MSTVCKVFVMLMAALLVAGCNKDDPCTKMKEVVATIKDLDSETRNFSINEACDKEEPKEIRQLFVARFFYKTGKSISALQWANYAVQTKPSYITYMHDYYYNVLDVGDAKQASREMEDKAASYGVKQAIFNKINRSDFIHMEKEEASPYISWMLLGTLDYSNVDTEQSTSKLYKAIAKLGAKQNETAFEEREEYLTSMFPEILGVVTRSPELRSVMPSAGENAKDMIKYKINTDDFKRFY